MRALLALIPLALALAPVAACGTDDTEFSEEDQDLTQAGKKLIGEYLEQGSGAFRGLVLTGDAASANANHFFADIDTGIVCITTPCPSVERVEGTFTAGSKTLTLKSTTASAAVKGYLGQYKYTFKSGKLSLTKKNFQQSLEEVDSYCAGDSVESDCSVTASDSAFPDCVGSWTCSAESTCGWDCGVADKHCGGFAGFQCDDDEYCDYEEEAMCGAGDQMGTCQPKPDVCPLGCPAPQYQPCGCDGQQYCNACDAHKAGVDVSEHVGSCG